MIIGYAELKVRGQLHDNSCKKNGLNNSVPSVLSVLGISFARTKKLRNLKTYKPKLKVSIPPKPEAAPFGGRGPN